MKNKPTFLKFVLNDKRHLIKYIIVLITIIISFFTTPIIINSVYDETPIPIIIIALLSQFGFIIGLSLQPWLIYKKLVKMDYWK